VGAFRTTARGCCGEVSELLVTEEDWADTVLVEEEDEGLREAEEELDNAEEEASRLEGSFGKIAAGNDGRRARTAAPKTNNTITTTKQKQEN